MLMRSYLKVAASTWLWAVLRDFYLLIRWCNAKELFERWSIQLSSYFKIHVNWRKLTRIE